jgi:hypothetical protein
VQISSFSLRSSSCIFLFYFSIDLVKRSVSYSFFICNSNKESIIFSNFFISLFLKFKLRFKSVSF